jgi:DNA polymerase III subunit delta'
MSFADFPEQEKPVQLLQRSLESGRLAHAYLFAGHSIEELEGVARTLAKVLNCAAPPKRGQTGLPIDSCDQCSSCRRIEESLHPDVHWVRPESKSRVILIEQMRELMQTIFLKASEAFYKVAILSAADRLKSEAANAFLKTLEEPPPRSVVVLLTTEPQHIVETILSRCQRLIFAGEAGARFSPATLEWLSNFAQQASVAGGQGLMAAYKLLDQLLLRLEELKKQTESELAGRSPLQKYEDPDPKTRDRWESELNAAVEAEYRRKRGELISGLLWWLRDVWVQAQGMDGELAALPSIATATDAVARRITPRQAAENIAMLDQTLRLLGTNVQEALTLEVALLKLKL